MPRQNLRQRYRSPPTNSLVERFFGSLKYNRLYREDIRDGVQFVDEVAGNLDLYNRHRPHESLAFLTPLAVYLDPGRL